MATLPLKASRKEQRSVIHFLWAKGLFAQMPFTLRYVQFMVTKCFTRPAIHVWCEKFACGRENVVDEKRPDRCVVSTTDAVIAVVASLMRGLTDACVTISVEINLENMLKNKRLMFDI